MNTRTKRKKSELVLPCGRRVRILYFPTAASMSLMMGSAVQNSKRENRERRNRNDMSFYLMGSARKGTGILYTKRCVFTFLFALDQIICFYAAHSIEMRMLHHFFGSRFVKFPMVARQKYHGHISRVNRYFIPPGMLCKSLRELFLNTQKCSPLRTDRPEGDAAGLIFLPAPQRAGTPARSGRCTKGPRDPGRRKAVRHSARPRRSPRPTESPWRHCAGCGRSSGAAM